MDILAHRYSTCITCQAMAAEVERLTVELAHAEHDPIWGIHNRQGVERRMKHLTDEHATIVLDLDKMHDANAALGHDGVDQRLNKIMRIADVLSGRWLRGDEIVLFPHQDDAIGLAYRILGALQAHDLSATIAVVWGNTHQAISLGLARIEQAKADDQRGRVYVVEGGAV